MRLGTQNYLWGMGVHFTPKQEAQLSQIASHSGTDTEQLVKAAPFRLVEEDKESVVASRRQTGENCFTTAKW